MIEPFRVKVVEPFRHTTAEERKAALDVAGNNLFQLKAEDVLMDLLTDSGTGAMSCNQWSAMMKADESYAGARSFYQFQETVREITGFNHVIPTHEGRLAERILFRAAVQANDLVPNNTHFDTTRANVQLSGATALDIPIMDSQTPAFINPFAGNIDLHALARTIDENPGRVPLALISVTNTSGGGQPVSMENIALASGICHERGIPLFLDASRFAENAWFIKTREEGYADRTPLQIAQEMFHYADGATMSAKNDGMANTGGFLALNDDLLAEACRTDLTLTEGPTTHGGIAGRDLAAIAVGLMEALDEDYLGYRSRSIADLGDALTRAGIPIVLPAGGHAIFLDAKAMLPHIPQDEYPAWALSLVLYLEGGVRSTELGSVTFGRQPDGSEKPAAMEMVRLAFPHRTYSQAHMEYLAEVLLHVHTLKDRIRGLRIVEEPANIAALCCPPRADPRRHGGLVNLE